MRNSIKEIRKKLKMSQSVFATAIGVGKSAISNYEYGYREPNRKTALKLIKLASSKGIRISLEEIYGFAGGELRPDIYPREGVAPTSEGVSQKEGAE